MQGKLYGLRDFFLLGMDLGIKLETKMTYLKNLGLNYQNCSLPV